MTDNLSLGDIFGSQPQAGNRLSLGDIFATPDVGKGESLARGALYGALQQPRDVIAAGYANLAGGVPFQEGLQMAKENSMEGAQGAAAQAHPGYFTGGQIAGTVASSFVPASWATKAVGAAAPIISKAPVIGSALADLASGIGSSSGLLGVPAAGAIQGGVQSEMTQGDLSGMLPGAIGAGIVGSLGKLAQPISNISSARQGYTDILKEAGINDLTPGQLTGSKALNTVESVLGNMLPTAGAASDKIGGQLQKFTQAALAKAGIDANEITPEVRAAAEQNFSNRYSNMFAGKTVNIDEPVLDTVAQVTTKQLNKLPTNVKPIVQSYLKDIVQAPEGQLSGEAYQEARSALTSQAHGMSVSDPTTANTLRTIRDSLDGAAMRSIPEADQGQLTKLNREYSNYKNIQKAASQISNNSLEGRLSPSALAQVVETANKGKSQAGYGGLYDLSRAGRAVLANNIPDSGTAQRLAAQSLLSGGVGGSVYGYTKDPELAVGAAAGTFGIPKATQLLLNSPAAQRYFTTGIPLANKLATPAAHELGALYAAQKNK